MHLLPRFFFLSFTIGLSAVYSCFVIFFDIPFVLNSNIVISNFFIIWLITDGFMINNFEYNSWVRFCGYIHGPCSKSDKIKERNVREIVTMLILTWFVENLIKYLLDLFYRAITLPLHPWRTCQLVEDKQVGGLLQVVRKFLYNVTIVKALLLSFKRNFLRNWRAEYVFKKFILSFFLFIKHKSLENINIFDFFLFNYSC